MRPEHPIGSDRQVTGRRPSRLRRTSWWSSWRSTWWRSAEVAEVVSKIALSPLPPSLPMPPPPSSLSSLSSSHLDARRSSPPGQSAGHRCTRSPSGSPRASTASACAACPARASAIWSGKRPPPRPRGRAWCRRSPDRCAKRRDDWAALCRSPGSPPSPSCK